MPTMLFEPWGVIGRIVGFPSETFIAVPSTGAVLYRLVVNDPPEMEDFQPQRQLRAEKVGMSELDRLGLSHFLEIPQAEAMRWKASQRIARIAYPENPRIHLARTDRGTPGHVDVWVPADLVETLLSDAEVVG